MGRNYHIIGACSGWGAQIRECEKGPQELEDQGIFDRLKEEGVPIQEVEMLYPEIQAANKDLPLDQTLPLIKKFNLNISRSVKKACEKGLFPIVIGGDHSIAVGTWNAFPASSFGLLWIDAHMDLHTPKTTPSGAYHGMPLAGLLGYGAAEMSQLLHKKPVLHPQDIALVGVRSYEEGEEELVKEKNIKVYFVEEVHERGFQTVMKEAIQHVTKRVPHFGVSFDLDVVTPEEAPGIGSPEGNGITTKELLPVLKEIGKNKDLICFEMVEYNPERDKDHKTSELSFEILKRIMQT